MGIQSSINKFDSIKKSCSSPASSSPLDIQIEHLETLFLVWLDEKKIDDQNQLLKKRLREYVTFFANFDDVKSCEQWLKSRPNDEKILLIVSGRFGKRIVPNIHHLTSIIGIYIFCWIPEDHLVWTQNYSKIRGVISKQEELIQQIFRDRFYFENIEDSKAIQFFKNRPNTQIIDSEYTSVIWYQLFLEILISPSYLPSSPSPREFIEILRRSISNDQESLNLIKEFEDTYDQQNAIQWLIKNTPLTRFINKALREQNISILFYLRFFLVDIYNQLISNSLSSIRVYRKQIMSSEKMKNIHSNINNYLMLNHFLSTSTKLSEYSSIDNNEYQTVFIEIDAQYHDGSVPFAYVDDETVIFMCGSIFKIISLEQKINSTWILKLSLAGNRELDRLNEKRLKLRQTKDLLMIFELLDQLNQSNQANIYRQQLIRQFPSDHPLIRRINVNSNIQSISLTHSKFLLIDLTSENLSPLAFSMLNVLQSLTKDSILIVNNYSEINFSQMEDKSIFIFTNSKIYSSMKKEIHQKAISVSILDEDGNSTDQLGHYNDSKDFIFQLSDELLECYTREVKDHLRSDEICQATQKKELVNRIPKELKKVHRTFSQNDQTSICTETTIIWLKFNNNNDQIIIETENSFKNIVSSFMIFDDCEECFGHLCTDGLNHSVFLIIDNNYQEKSLATLQTLNNIKKMFRYNQLPSTKEIKNDDQNNVCVRLTFDLIGHYNQLAKQCEENKDSDNAKKMFSKARLLCELLPKL